MVKQITSQPDRLAVIHKQSRAILIALLFPTMAIILNGSMFGVALPVIRDEFMVTADVASWLTIAFTLPFMMFMPLYGRLGDQLGRTRLLVTGLIIFCLGSGLALSANNLLVLFIGRLIQGMGSAGVTPLSLAIIAQRFSAEERGKALGTWNSIAPGTSIFAPSIGGFLVDHIGWRTIFIPAIVVGIFAVMVVRRQIPGLRQKSNWSILQKFDWVGFFLLGGAINFLIFYVSSRPVTGVEPFQDWRLLIVCVLLGIWFVKRERQRVNPFIDLHILEIRSFRLASILAGLRMAMMIGIGFLAPLYLTDVYDMNASTIGILATIHAVGLFILVRFGGNLADRWSNRLLVVISLCVQMFMMGFFAILPGGVHVMWIVGGILIHGLGAGLALASLHRTALGNIVPEHTGSAAGIYSMTRFAGSMLSTAIAGILLQNGLDRGLEPITAYQIVFGFLAVVGLAGVLLASRLQE